MNTSFGDTGEYRSELERKINTMKCKVGKSASCTQIDFNGGCIGSSRGFTMAAGKMFAVPHSTGRRSHSVAAARLLMPRLQGHSEYSAQFAEQPFCYSSMDNKPMVKYDPIHYRSRNMIEDVVMPYKNASVVQFDAGMVGRTLKPFATTMKTSHDGQVASFITNAVILADQLKQKKASQAK